MNSGTTCADVEIHLLRQCLVVVAHTGANLRAYHFLCFQTQLGYRENEPITLTAVSDVIPSVIELGWVNPAPRETYSKYLDGDMNVIADDMRGKKTERIMGYHRVCSSERSVDLSHNNGDVSPTMAAFWSMLAPKELPTLPGIGGDGRLYQRFGSPKMFWNSNYIETLQVRQIILDEVESMPVKAPIILKVVSKAPVIRQEPWDPILGDSVHACAWWTLTNDEVTAVIEDQKKQSTKRPASQMIEATPIAKAPPNPKASAAERSGTTSKSLAVPPEETQNAKAPIVKAPATQLRTDEPQLPAIEVPLPKKSHQLPPVEFRGNAGIREQSETRGRRPTAGSGRRVPLAAAVLGKCAPMPPPTAVGTAGVPIAQLTERETHQRTDLDQEIRTITYGAHTSNLQRLLPQRSEEKVLKHSLFHRFSQQKDAKKRKFHKLRVSMSHMSPLSFSWSSIEVL